MTITLINHYISEEYLKYDKEDFKKISKDNKVAIASPANITVKYLPDETKVESIVTQEVKTGESDGALYIKVVCRGIIESDTPIPKEIQNFPQFCFRLVFPYIQAEVKRLTENTGLSPVILNGDYDSLEVI